MMLQNLKMETLEDLLEERKEIWKEWGDKYSLYKLYLVLHPEKEEYIGYSIDIDFNKIGKLLSSNASRLKVDKSFIEEIDRIGKGDVDKQMQEVDTLLKDSRVLAEFIFDASVYGIDDAEENFIRKLSK